MTRVRILHVIPSLDQSGAEKQLALLAIHLPADRFETHVCAVTRGGYYERVLRDAGVPVHLLGKRIKWDPFALWRLKRLMTDLKPDIVQTWLFAGNAYGRVAARWACIPRVIASERCVDEWKSGYHHVVDRLLARWTDRFVVNAVAIRDFYVRRGIPADRIRVIRNGIEMPELSPSERGQGAMALPPAARGPLTSDLGIPADTPLIGFVGRLWPQKRVQDLIWAADILRLSGWNFHVVIVGDGPRRASLEQFADSLEITDRVHFLGHRDDAGGIIGALDMLVLPSKFEGLPNVVLEAMQASRPVIATRIPGVDEVVADGQTGILVTPKSPLELARAMRTLLNDPDLAIRMGQAGRERVLREYSRDRMIDEYARLYDELMDIPVRSNDIPTPEGRPRTGTGSESDEAPVPDIVAPGPNTFSTT